MKGIILAGGSGTRLYPATIGTNKHCLPIYNKPMIYYPLSVLMLAGIRDVLIISNPEDIDSFKRLFANGSGLGMRVEYAIQDRPRGLADGLIIGGEFIAGDNACLILGDNIFFGHGLPDMLLDARRGIEEEGGACVFGHYVTDPERYGVVEFDEKGNAVSLEEKPSTPKSNYAVVGLYFYDSNAAEVAGRITPSARGELEITSVNEAYLKQGKLKVKLLGRGFAWFDAGTHDSFLEGGEFVATIEKKTGLMIGCIEEIAFHKGWIDKTRLLRLAEPLKKTEYGQYLLRVVAEEKDAV